MMNDAEKIRPVVIVGPTAGGKSELAVAVAERLGVGRAEIVSADSMQVYRGMDAGTAKPSAQLRARVVHHLIDIVDPTDRFTVMDWAERAEGIIEDLLGRGVWPIVVGGTNLYLKAMLEGMFAGPSADPVLRAELERFGSDVLHDRLLAVDPMAAGRIHRNDRRKLVRALEVYQVTGEPISSLQSQWSDGGSSDRYGGEPASVYRRNPVLVGLDWPTEVINRRINQRVKGMFFPDGVKFRVDRRGQEFEGVREGLVDEVRRLEAGRKLGVQASQAIGYKQVMDYLHGRMTLEEAFEKTKIVTRRFAKSQRTWLRRYRGVKWLSAEDRGPDDLAAEAASVVMSI